MKGKGIDRKNSFVWLAKAPFRLLIMARNAYIRSITSCSGAGIVTGGGSSGFGHLAGNFQICEAPSTALPRSFNLASKALDQGWMTCDRKLTTGMAIKQAGPLDHRMNYRCVVIMPRIDEENSCDEEFQEEDYFLDYGKCEIDKKN